MIGVQTWIDELQRKVQELQGENEDFIDLLRDNGCWKPYLKEYTIIVRLLNG